VREVVKFWRTRRQVRVMRRRKVDKKRRVNIRRAQGASLACSSPEPREILEVGLNTIS